MAAFDPYVPRRFALSPVRDVAGHRLKGYTIALPDADPVSERLLGAGERETALRLPPAAADEGESAGLGFTVLHEGALGTWLLMHWWAHGDICCQRLSHAAPGSTEFQAVDARPLMACVWELSVIAHERQAWIKAMLRSDPDPDGYLADVLPAGTY